MPLQIQDRDDIYRRLKKNWQVEDGNYLVTIEDINSIEIADGRKPLQWTLHIHEGKRIKKMHWIDTKGGTNLLIYDLKNIGIETTPDQVFSTLNQLIGERIRVLVEYNGEHQNITFIERA